MSETERERQTDKADRDRQRQRRFDVLLSSAYKPTRQGQRETGRQTDRQRSWSEVSSDAAKTCFDYSVDQLLL